MTVARCSLCRSSLLKCSCHAGNDEPVRGSKRGDFRRNGAQWCGSCHSRVNGARCSNVTCSSNR